MVLCDHIEGAAFSYLGHPQRPADARCGPWRILQLQAEVVRVVERRSAKAPQKCTWPSCPSVSSEDVELPPKFEYIKGFRETRKKTVSLIGIDSFWPPFHFYPYRGMEGKFPVEMSETLPKGVGD